MTPFGGMGRTGNAVDDSRASFRVLPSVRRLVRPPFHILPAAFVPVPGAESASHLSVTPTGTGPRSSDGCHLALWHARDSWRAYPTVYWLGSTGSRPGKSPRSCGKPLAVLPCLLR
jgi:hypothetical protein